MNIAVFGGVALLLMTFLTGEGLFFGLAAAFVVIGPGGQYASLGVAAFARLGHRKSAATPTFVDIWPELSGSDEQHCLLLRPFGADGRILIRRSPRSQLERMLGALPVLRPFVYYRCTLEQILHAQLSQPSGGKTLALVDQSETHAPPGPLFLRTTDDEWQMRIRQLLSIATRIVIVIPPGFSISSGLQVEVDFIRELGMRDRTVVVAAPRVASGRIDRESDRSVHALVEELWGGTVNEGNLIFVSATYASWFIPAQGGRGILTQDMYTTSFDESARAFAAQSEDTEPHC